MSKISRRYLFSIQNRKFYVSQLGIYIDGKLEPKLIPASQDGIVIGLIHSDSLELMTFQSIPNFSYRTQLHESIEAKPISQRISKINESKEFLPVSREREGTEVEIPGT